MARGYATAWLAALALGGVAACGGRSLEHGTGDEPGAGGEDAGGRPTTGTSGTGAAGRAGAGGEASGASGGVGQAGNTSSSGTGGTGGTGGTAGAGGAGGNKAGGSATENGSELVREACGQFCGALPAACAGTEDCSVDCIHAGNDSPSSIQQFAAYMTCLGQRLNPLAACDSNCEGGDGCMPAATKACDAQRIAFELSMEECGTKTRDYEAPSAGCRRASACNAFVVECGPDGGGDTPAWDCTCTNLLPQGPIRLTLQPGTGDECLTAARRCQGL